MTSIAIPLYPGVDVLDVTGPYEMFSWAGFDVHLIAEQAGPIACRGGTLDDDPVAARRRMLYVEETFAPFVQYDILRVPGGDMPALEAMLGQSPRTYLDYLVAQSRGARMTCSVCEGAILLAAAGLLDGYEATTHWQFVNCFSRWPAVKIVPGTPRYVRDRDRLTGGGISSGLDEALMLIELVMDCKTARAVQAITQYFPDPPVHAELSAPPVCPILPLRPPAPA